MVGTGGTKGQDLIPRPQPAIHFLLEHRLPGGAPPLPVNDAHAAVAPSAAFEQEIHQGFPGQGDGQAVEVQFILDGKAPHPETAQKGVLQSGTAEPQLLPRLPFIGVIKLRKHVLDDPGLILHPLEGQRGWRGGAQEDFVLTQGGDRTHGMAEELRLLLGDGVLLGHGLSTGMDNL